MVCNLYQGIPITTIMEWSDFLTLSSNESFVQWASQHSENIHDQSSLLVCELPSAQLTRIASSTWMPNNLYLPSNRMETCLTKNTTMLRTVCAAGSCGEPQNGNTFNSCSHWKPPGAAFLSTEGNWWEKIYVSTHRQSAFVWWPCWCISWRHGREGKDISVLYNMAAAGHMCLLSIWDVLSATYLKDQTLEIWVT